MSTTQARRQFEALFETRNPTRDEMYLRPDFRLLVASVGMRFDECWDALIQKARRHHGGNIELAAADWYAQVSAPRL